MRKAGELPRSIPPFRSTTAAVPTGRTEIDFYNGHLVALAKDYLCPLNRGILELVKRMEKEGTPPHPDKLETLLSGR